MDVNIEYIKNKEGEIISPVVAGKSVYCDTSTNSAGNQVLDDIITNFDGSITTMNKNISNNTTNISTNTSNISSLKSTVSTNTSNISTLTTTVNSIKFESILSSTVSRTSTGSSTATLTTAGTSYDLLLCFVGYSKTEGKWVIVKPSSSQGSSTNFDIAAYSASYQAWGNIVWNYTSTKQLTFTLNEFGGWSTIGLWFVYGLKL